MSLLDHLGLHALPYSQSKVRPKHGKAVFQYYAPKTWNKLPENHRLASSLQIIKSGLKTLLFAGTFWKTTLLLTHFNVMLRFLL